MKLLHAGVLCDRDGTLIDDVGYPAAGCEVRLIEGAAEALLTLHTAGAAVCIVSNQSGVGRGLITTEDVAWVDAQVRRQLASHGVPIAGSYYCHHHPAAGCACRKPAPGLLDAAMAELGLDRLRCAMVGDRASDAAAASAAGISGFLLASSSWAQLVPAIMRVVAA